MLVPHLRLVNVPEFLSEVTEMLTATPTMETNTGVTSNRALNVAITTTHNGKLENTNGVTMLAKHQNANVLATYTEDKEVQTVLPTMTETTGAMSHMEQTAETTTTLTGNKESWTGVTTLAQTQYTKKHQSQDVPTEMQSTSKALQPKMTDLATTAKTELWSTNTDVQL